jgi:PAS domain S-box-containing protein
MREGKMRMDVIRDLVSSMRKQEHALLSEREIVSRAAFHTSLTTGLLASLVGLILVGACVALVIGNLSARQKAAEILYEQKEWFRTTLASIGDGVIATDTSGRITFMNEIAEKLTGWSEQEARGASLESVFSIVHEATRQPVENPALQALKAGKIVGLANHTILIARDGTEWPLDDSAAPVRDDQGRVRGSVLVFREIVKRKEAEKRLRESEHQFKTLADSIPQMAWMTRPDGYIVWYNSRWYEYTGTTPEQMEGWGWQSVHDPGELPRVLKNWKAALASGTPWEDTFPLRRKDGTMRWHLSRAFPVQDEKGTIVRWFGTNTDISDRMQVELELKEADRRKDEFLATLAHELRNPLAPLRTALEIMKLSGDDPKSFETVRELMERQLSQMVRLIDELMDVSRISRNKIQLRLNRVDLAEVIESSIETSRPLIDASGHELTVTLPPQPIHLHADFTRLAQVFSNLLNNASKYTEHGGKISVCAQRQGSDAVVSVRDNGVGIPAHQLSRIFEMFSQVDQSLARSQGGLGIGLTLVRRLTELHGGGVEAHSAGPGTGSEFIVRLPIALSTPDRVEPGAPVHVESGEFRTYRTLIVDDNRDAVTTLAMMLKSMGHQIRVAHDGLESLEVAEAFQPQVVLMDIGLPKLNGYGVARRMRERPWGREAVLIATTGWGQDEDHRRSQEAGFDHHMVKPIEPAALEKLLTGLQPLSA